MVHFCEINKTDSEHAMVNRGLIQLLSEAYPDQKLKIHVSPSHLDALGFDDVTFSYLLVQQVQVLSPVAGSKVQWLKKLWEEGKLLFQLLGRGKNTPAHLLFFSSLSPLGAFLLSFFSRRWMFKGPVVLTLHGELQLLISKPSKAIDKVYARLLGHALKRPGPSLSFLVLDPFVKQFLVQNGFVLPHAIFQIPHPIRFPAPEVPDVRPSPPLVIGHIGVAKHSKNSSVFFKWAEKFSYEIEANHLRFVLAGAVLPEMVGHTNEYVEHEPGHGFIDEFKFQSLCKEMHYAVFLYQEEHYQLVSSGALMEAISFEIPILALRTARLEALFAQVHPAPGKLYEDAEALYQDLVLFCRYGKQDPSMLSGIRKLKSHYSMPQLAVELRAALDHKPL